MGIKEFFGGNADGMDCVEDPETGGLHCRKFKIDKNSKLSTGSEAIVQVDPQTCKAFFVGRYSVLKEDEADFDRIAKKKEQSCRGGLQ